MEAAGAPVCVTSCDQGSRISAGATETVMSDLQLLRRALYHHDWTDVGDWADCIARLADLTDEQITMLAAGDGASLRECEAADGGPNREGVRALAGHPGGMRGWCGQLCASLALSLGLKYKRA